MLWETDCMTLLMIQVWFSHVPGTLVVVPGPVVHLDLVHEVKMTQQMTSLLPPAPDCLVGEGLVDDPPQTPPVHSDPNHHSHVLGELLGVLLGGV